LEIAVTKMIGTSRVRSRRLMYSAVSKPSMLGHLDVEQDHREVVVQQALSASSPEVAVTQRQASGARHGLERDEVLGPVVDEQDGRGRVGGSAPLIARGSRAAAGNPRRSGTTARRRTAASAARGISGPLGVVGVLHDREPAARRTGAGPARRRRWTRSARRAIAARPVRRRPPTRRARRSRAG
jgi:hypothetical protein